MQGFYQYAEYNQSGILKNVSSKISYNNKGAKLGKNIT
jgi:hypothetical protein